MAYSKQTWDTTSYVNPTRMNHIEDGIASADLTGGGIIEGSLTVRRNDNYGLVAIGKGSNANENGILQIYDKAQHYANIYPVDDLGGPRTFRLPNKNGTIALTNDLDWTLIYENLTFDSERKDVSAYRELYIVPKLQGYARSYPTFMLRLPSFDIATAGVEYSGSSITNGIMYGVNIDSSNTLKLRGTLKGWSSVTFDIYGRK